MSTTKKIVSVETLSAVRKELTAIIKTVKSTDKTFRTTSFENGIKLGMVVNKLIKLENKSVGEIVQNVSSRTGWGKSTITEYKRWALPENQKILKAHKVKIIDDARKALKGTAPSENGGGDNTPAVTPADTPATTADPVTGTSTIEGETIDDNSTTIITDYDVLNQLDVENQAGRIFSGILDAIKGNPISDRSLILDILSESCHLESIVTGSDEKVS